MTLITPREIPRPFAESGDKSEIPDSQIVDYLASFVAGFPPRTSLPISAGGKPPTRTDVNGILNHLSQFAVFQQSGGTFDWSSGRDYIARCEVYGSDGKKYVALAESGPGTSAGAKDPVQDTAGTFWTEFGGFDPNTIQHFSESQWGLGRLATIAQTSDPSINTLAVSPAGLQNALRNYVPPDIPRFTETVWGIARAATVDETRNGTSRALAVTPYSLTQFLTTWTPTIRNFSESDWGLGRVATIAETLAGQSRDRAVSPYSLANLTATTDRRGIVELATDQEAASGTDTQRAVTPAGVRSALSDRRINTTTPITGGASLASNPTIGVDIASSDELRSLYQDSSNVLTLSTFRGLGRSLGESGYYVLPGGLIIQWGKISWVNLSQKCYDVSFPISFPSAFIGGFAQVSMNNFVSGNVTSLIKRTPTRYGMTVCGDDDYDGSAYYGDVYWFVIGT